MIRRLFLLNGLSIFAVVCNHAGYLGFLAMFWWIDLYRPVVSVPNFDQIGSLSYYVLLVIRQLAVFCVPAFLFTTGFFIAYTARGNQSQLTWKVILRRLVFLLIPYLLWSLVWFAFDFSRGTVYPPIEYIKRLILGEANDTYFYVIALSLLYLLSPLLVPLVKNKWKWALIGSSGLLIFSLGLKYENTFGMSITSPLHFLYSNWFVTLWLLYFVLGVIVSFFQREFTSFILKFKWVLLATTVITALLSLIEADRGFRLLKQDWFGPSTITSSFYVISFILCFLAFQEVKIPLSNFFNLLGHNIYGIYLTHWIVMEVTAWFLLNTAPKVLASEFILQSILILLGVGLPLIFISMMAKTPARRFYRFVFG